MKNDVILKVENLSKQYRLGTISTGTISHDLNRWWHKIRGKEDPYLKIGESNDRSSKGESEYVWALKDINFEVKRGEVLGIIGKNGAGKSTLLKILSQVTSPTTGSIKTKGRIASLLEVGTGFHPEMTGAENIYLNGAILGMTKKEIKSKFDEIVEFSGCERYIDTPVKRYSSGMKVRLAFAVAAFLEPDILVVDEVLAVGDAEFQKKAIGKMQDISKGDGRTVLFVSHDMGAIMKMCNKVIVLEKGMIMYQGSVNESIEYYQENKRNFSKLSKGLYSIDDIYIKGKPNSILNVYEPIKIIVHVSRNISDDVIVKINLNIRNSNNVLVSSLSSSLTSSKIEFLNGKAIVEIQLPDGFNFFEGYYFVDIRVFDSIQYYFYNAFRFMLANDSNLTFYQNKVNSKVHGLVYTPQKWNQKN